MSLDKTKPTITGSRTPAANGFGWNNTDVTVHFDAKDTLSGIASVTADKTFGEGTNQSLEGTAVDAAGNSASTTVGGINVDKTAPTLSGKPVAGRQRQRLVQGRRHHRVDRRRRPLRRRLRSGQQHHHR